MHAQYLYRIAHSSNEVLTAMTFGEGKGRSGGDRSGVGVLAPVAAVCLDAGRDTADFSSSNSSLGAIGALLLPVFLPKWLGALTILDVSDNKLSLSQFTTLVTAIKEGKPATDASAGTGAD